MFKVSLVLFLVGSTFCQANPVELTQPPHQNVSVPATTEPAKVTDKPLNPSSEIPVAAKTNATTKGETKTVKPSDSSLTVTENPPPASPNTTVPPITTTPEPSTTTTKPTVPPSTPPTTHPTPKPSPPTPSPTPTPKPTSTLPPPAPTTPHPKPSPDGGFNLISFLGGMILGLGLLAIGYVIFKFYQTRRDSSYRTL